MSFESPLIINALTISILLLPPIRVGAAASKLTAWFGFIMCLSVWAVLPKLGLLSMLNDYGVNLGSLAELSFDEKFGGVDLMTLIVPNAMILFGAVSSIGRILKGNGHGRTS